ncbi:amino acid transporter AVT1C-like isoform X1 [Daucus carota subsp. sativus]|uniref:amino acid transporter AVT1C-like isoform X1 n=1 Tax=Daucus carota subsp. sativus TaxID=79200 RepID=UPI003083D32A
MKNSVSDSYLSIESEENDENVYDKGEDSDDSDSSNYSYNNEHNSRPASVSSAWPQSYRQSIDMSVPSPSLNFLGTPVLSRLSNSFLSSSLTKRKTPEIIQSTAKPLLQEASDEQQPQLRRSSHSLLPPITERKHAKKVTSDQKYSKVSHEIPVARKSSYGQAVLNGMNVLCGVGLLSTPYAVKEGGWSSLSLLFMFGILSFYTGILLRHCLDSQPGLETYPDIGQAAFGTTGRIVISIILYVELYASCVEYIILESDNLSSLFPNANLSLAGFDLNSRYLFAIITALTVLPTVWLKDLSILSYFSAGGVIASILVVVCLFWVGLVDDVGFHGKGTTLNFATLPVALGLYGFCYSGHAVFPNIYTSMENRSQFPLVLFTSFALCTVLYAGVAVFGYLMFGEETESQFTLNMPNHLVASKIAIWTTVVNPLTKYALIMSPVAMSLEELIPSDNLQFHIYSILIRTALVLSTLFVGLSVPFFGLVMSLIGSLLTMLVRGVFQTLILPCACFLSIFRAKVTPLQGFLCLLIITVGTVSSVFGSYSAIFQIIQQFV